MFPLLSDFTQYPSGYNFKLLSSNSEILNNPCVFYKSVFLLLLSLILEFYQSGGRRGHDHMVVGFTTTCAISDYHH